MEHAPNQEYPNKFINEMWCSTKQEKQDKKVQNDAELEQKHTSKETSRIRITDNMMERNKSRDKEKRSLKDKKKRRRDKETDLKKCNKKHKKEKTDNNDHNTNKPNLSANDIIKDKRKEINKIDIKLDANCSDRNAKTSTPPLKTLSPIARFNSKENLDHTKKEFSPHDVLTSLSLSKWEMDDFNFIKTETTSVEVPTLKSSKSPITKSSNIVNESVNEIHDSDKKVEPTKKDASPLLSTVIRPKNAEKQVVSHNFQITIPSKKNIASRSVELKNESFKYERVRSVVSPLRVSIKERLGAKVNDTNSSQERSETKYNTTKLIASAALSKSEALYRRGYKKRSKSPSASQKKIPKSNKEHDKKKDEKNSSKRHDTGETTLKALSNKTQKIQKSRGSSSSSTTSSNSEDNSMKVKRKKEKKSKRNLSTRSSADSNTSIDRKKRSKKKSKSSKKKKKSKHKD